MENVYAIAPRQIRTVERMIVRIFVKEKGKPGRVMAEAATAVEMTGGRIIHCFHVFYRLLADMRGSYDIVGFSIFFQDGNGFGEFFCHLFMLAYFQTMCAFGLATKLSQLNI
jgi:hypothetical protein